MTDQPIRIFIAYAHEDDTSRDKLRRQLNVLERRGHFQIFWDGLIQPGERWDTRLKDELHRADIFLLLVSEAFLDSDYVHEVELPKALQLRAEGRAEVLPIILRRCLWQHTELNDFQCILCEGKPIETAPDGFAHVAEQVVETVNAIKAKRQMAVQATAQLQPAQAAVRDVDESQQNDKKNDPFHDLMIPIKGGSFKMGDTFGDGFDDEKPVHRVTVPDFLLCKYPVTQAQWKQIMGDNLSHFKDDSRPVVQVSWGDAQAFLKKLNEKAGKKYRLPTEAEWEYAAKGGSQSKGYKYAGSNDLKEVGWYDKNSNSKTHPVGQKKPNELGLYDMSGNVWEWVEDDWHSNYKNAPTDGSVWAGQGTRGGNRVSRGGGWLSEARFCRIGIRRNLALTYRYRDTGLRLALSSQ